MNAYETTFIVRPDLDDDQIRATTEQVTGRVESAGGEIIAAYAWSPARRRMAYPIRDFGDGFYATATFRLDPQAVRELENVLKLNDNILRFLIVQASDQAIRQSQQRAQQQAAAAAAPPAPAEPAMAETEAETAPVPVEEVEETLPQPEPVTTAAAPASTEAEE